MIYAGYIFTCVIGWLLIPNLTARFLERVAMSFAMGAFAISIEMFAFDLAGIGWNRWVVLLPWVVLGAVRLYQGRGGFAPGVSDLQSGRQRDPERRIPRRNRATPG